MAPAVRSCRVKFVAMQLLDSPATPPKHATSARARRRNAAASHHRCRPPRGCLGRADLAPDLIRQAARADSDELVGARNLSYVVSTTFMRLEHVQMMRARDFVPKET